MRAIVHVATSFSLPVDGQPVRSLVGGALMRSDPEPQVGSCTVWSRLVSGPMPITWAMMRETSAGRVELSLALARLSREVPHEVFVGVAQEVVAMGAIGAKIEPLEDPDQFREALLHLLALAELRLVIEVRLVDHALEQEVVGVGERADDLVDPVADLLRSLERDHVGEASPPAAP